MNVRNAHSRFIFFSAPLRLVVANLLDLSVPPSGLNGYCCYRMIELKTKLGKKAGDKSI